MSSLRRKLKGKKPPEGWELIEEVINDFEEQMKEAVNEDHEGKRKAELNWKVHRIHWERNRFIYDLMYVRKVMSRELYDWLVREKIADGSLIAKWRKPGYELLCSMLAIQRGGHNFGTTSHCRVPFKLRASQQRVSPDVQTGCISCASGDGRFGGPIWWNTPMEEGADEEEHRATWGQASAPPPPSYGGGSGGGAPSRKRAPDDDDEELDDVVKKRLAALKGSALD